MKLTAKQMLKLTQFHVNTHTHTHARSLIHKRKLIMAVEKRRFKLQTKIILEEKQSNKLSIKSLENICTIKFMPFRSLHMQTKYASTGPSSSPAWCRPCCCSTVPVCRRSLGRTWAARLLFCASCRPARSCLRCRPPPPPPPR